VRKIRPLEIGDLVRVKGTYGEEATRQVVGVFTSVKGVFELDEPVNNRQLWHRKGLIVVKRKRRVPKEPQAQTEPISSTP